jgi:hypothetical protein
VRANVLILLLVGATCAAPTSPVELIPTSSAVIADCEIELGNTYCDEAKAKASARVCESRLTSAEKAGCDPQEGCLATYEPKRPGTCAAGRTYNSLSECAAPVADNCSFYRSCLDAAHPCGAEGYALGFGEPFCYLFIDRRAEFSPAGQRWLQRVRTCLQEHLAHMVAGSVASCDELADKAFASHTICYTELGNSFCDLPNEDVSTLSELLLPYLGNPRVTPQIEDVASICAKRSDGGP